MKRGDVVTVATGGDSGKPRPAVIVQSDDLPPTETVLVCLVTSTLTGHSIYRLLLEPTKQNGLRRPSEVMVDKVQLTRRHKVGATIGALSDTDMLTLSRMLAVVMGLADSRSEDR